MRHGADFVCGVYACMHPWCMSHMHIQSSYNDMTAWECCIFNKFQCQLKDPKEFMKSVLQALTKSWRDIIHLEILIRKENNHEMKKTLLWLNANLFVLRWPWCKCKQALRVDFDVTLFFTRKGIQRHSLKWPACCSQAYNQRRTCRDICKGSHESFLCQTSKPCSIARLLWEWRWMFPRLWAVPQWEPLRLAVWYLA